VLYELPNLIPGICGLSFLVPLINRAESFVSIPSIKLIPIPPVKRGLVSDDNEESKFVDKLIEKIVRCYSTCINYEEEIENIKLIGLENGMYNILYYSNINDDHIYNNSLFIIK
jgi:hypothetical protein